jgi:HK97 family phage prohead protease
MKRKLETRLMPTRSTTTTSDNSVTGIAVPYGQLSHPIQGAGRSFREKVKPGALTYDENTVLLTQHDQRGVPLARVGAGTLSFRETKQGLEFTATLPESRADLREALERGDMSGAVSIGFYVEDDGDRWTHANKQSLREVTQGHLVELSLVSPAGAYPGARITHGGKPNG